MELERKRVGCLYRVSTKKQVNVEDDIPMQRNARSFSTESSYSSWAIM